MLHGIVHTAVTCRLTVTEDSLVTVHIEAVSQPISAESSDSDLQAVNHAEAGCPAAAVAPASSAPFDPYTWLAASGLLVPSQEAVSVDETEATSRSGNRLLPATTAAPLAALMSSSDQLHAAAPDGPPCSSLVCELCNARCTSMDDLLTHLRGRRHKAAVAAQDSSASKAAEMSGKAVPAYSALWQPPPGTEYACRICRFAGSSHDAKQHFKSNNHNKACQILMSQGLAICKPCGRVCPNLGNLKEYYWPSQRHQSRVSWLESKSTGQQAKPACPTTTAAHGEPPTVPPPPPPPPPRPVEQVAEPDGTAAADHAASASTATPTAEQNTVSLAKLLEVVTCPVTKGIMCDPCIAGDGITYERSAIESHLASRNTSPVLGIELAHSHVTPNNAVRELTAWLASVGVIEP